MPAQFRLNRYLARTAGADSEDVLNVKHALKDLGLYNVDYEVHDTPDTPLFYAIGRFQQREGLRADGVMIGNVGGSEALNEIGDKHAAAAFADVLYREGITGGTRMIRDAINNVKSGTVTETGDMGAQTQQAFKEMASQPETRAKLLNELGNVRNDKRDTEDDKTRHEFFRFRGTW